jgi:hypothetical protein
VNGTERSVKFWNTITIADTDSTGKERKFRVRINIVGHGIDTGAWVEHEYTSPLPRIPLQPEKTFEVPSLGLAEYHFIVTGPWELYERQLGEYTKINQGTQGSETATVKDNSTGS